MEQHRNRIISSIFDCGILFFILFFCVITPFARGCFGHINIETGGKRIEVERIDGATVINIRDIENDIAPIVSRRMTLNTYEAMDWCYQRDEK